MADNNESEADQTVAIAQTAREQAAQAVESAVITGSGDTATWADAASDVWEPLLREASALLRDHGTGGEVTRFLLRLASVLDPADDPRFGEGSGSPEAQR